MAEYLLGIDIGTYSTKGCLVKKDGSVAASAVRNHTILSPKPGFAEHDPVRQWWREFIEIIDELKKKAGISAEAISAIGISTIMAGVVFMDKQLNPLRNAILYGIDSRTTAQAQKLNILIGEQNLEKKSGHICTNESFGPKILWVRENEKTVFEKTEHITFASGFLVARLTGEFVVDPHSAQGAQPMIDCRDYSWNSEYCQYVCDETLLPRICRTTEIVGSVTSSAAFETGLSAGTPVICGTTDAAAEAVSVGVVDVGDTMLMYGSTAFMIHLTKQPIQNRLLWKAPFVIDGRYGNCLGMGTTGSLTTWFKDQFAKDLITQEESNGLNAFDMLFKEAEGIDPGSNGLLVLPYFLGQRMPIADPLARGTIFGITLNHTRGHIMRAVFEGIGYGIGEMLSCLPEDSFPKMVKAVGGGVKTPLWLQIVSDITGVSQSVPMIKIGASYGDALLAGIGMGVFTKDDIKNDIIEDDFCINPNTQNTEVYIKYRKLYSCLVNQTRDIMHNLSEGDEK